MATQMHGWDDLAAAGLVPVTVDLNTDLDLFDRSRSGPADQGSYCGYVNVATCPDCGAGMMQYGRCVACPSCGLEGCGM